MRLVVGLLWLGACADAPAKLQQAEASACVDGKIAPGCTNGEALINEAIVACAKQERALNTYSAGAECGPSAYAYAHFQCCLKKGL